MLTLGTPAYVANLSAILDKVVTVHHGPTPEIIVESADSATGIWAMEDKLWVEPSSALPFVWMHGYGQYHERYERLSDGCRIKDIRLSRLRVDIG